MLEVRFDIGHPPSTSGNGELGASPICTGAARDQVGIQNWGALRVDTLTRSRGSARMALVRRTLEGIRREAADRPAQDREGFGGGAVQE